jgi:hypothetical protein
MMDITVGAKGSPRNLTNTIDPSNLTALIEQLQIAKQSDNHTEARKIRALLRKHGHRGGARAAAQLATSTDGAKEDHGTSDAED